MQRGTRRGKPEPPRFRFDASKSYLAFYKPFGVLSQFTPEAGTKHKTLAEFGFPPGVYPVGRLDHDSEGLLILTDDPRLNQELLNPGAKRSKTYLAQVERVPEAQDLMRLEKGVLIEGRRTLPARAVLLAAEPTVPDRPTPIRYRKNVPTSWLEITIVEGRNRQVRKMTAAIGFPTIRLLRKAIGSLDMFTLVLSPGEWLRLSHHQLDQVLSDYQPVAPNPGARSKVPSRKN